MDDRDHFRMERLQPFVGGWRVEAPSFDLPADVAAGARTSFEWILDGAFLLERSTVPGSAVPDGHSVIGLGSAGDYLQHYFDSRGIARLYRMTFDDREWVLERHEADFSPLPFHQRWLGRFSEDGDAIHGRWETSSDGHTWALDFELVYRRIR